MSAREDKKGICPTMGVNANGKMIFNRQFVMGLSEDELEGALCFKGDTVITSPDTKSIKDIKIGDIVYDKYGNNTKVRKLYRRKYNGKMIKLYPVNMLPIECTPNHPFLVGRYEEKTSLSIKRNLYGIKIHKVRADEVKIGDVIIIPKIKGSKRKHILSIREFRSRFRNEKVKIDKISLNKDMAFLMGLYVAGSSNNNTIVISLSANKKQDILVAKKIKKIVKDNLNLVVHSKRRLNVLVLSIFNASLARAFKYWFGVSKTKHIPNFIMNIGRFNDGKKITKSFLDGYIAGDGCQYKKNNRKIIQMATVNRILALQLQILYIKIGIFPNLYHYQRKGVYHKINGKDLKDLSIYQLSFPRDKVRNRGCYVNKDGQFAYSKIRKIVTTNYNGQVYNFDAGGNHTYLANNVSVGNCHEGYHCIFQHINKNRIGSRHPLVWNYAADAVTNYMLFQEHLKLPSGVITPRSNSVTIGDTTIVDLDKKTAEHVYDEICQALKDQDDKDPGSEDGKVWDKHIYDSSGDDDDSDDGDQNGTKVESVAGVPKSERDWSKVAVQAVNHAKSKGKNPAGMERMIDDLLDAKINWRNLIHRKVTDMLPFDFSWRMPHKKSISTGFYMPSVVKENLELVASVDTSGSISQQDLTEFISELVHIGRSFANLKATIIFFDCQIHDVYEVNNHDLVDIMNYKIKGGGGTDHRPVFKWIEKNKPNAQLVVHFTDGDSNFGDDIPRYQNVWVLSKNSVSKEDIPFGDVIKIED